MSNLGEFEISRTNVSSGGKVNETDIRALSPLLAPSELIHDESTVSPDVGKKEMLVGTGVLGEPWSRISSPTIAPAPTPFIFHQPRTAVIQIWEGKVVEVNVKRQVMYVRLTGKRGKVEDLSAEISLQWVHDQDRDLVRPGAIFYWTIFRETKGSTISNSEDLRFRRLPSWSRVQIAKIRAMVDELRNKTGRKK